MLQHENQKSGVKEMKENDRLNIIFDKARSDKPITDYNSVEKLVKSGKRISAGKIKLGKPGRGLFNPLNLIIMISTIAIITSLIIIFNGKPHQNINEEDFGIHIYEQPEVIHNIEQDKLQSHNTEEDDDLNEKDDSEEIILISPGISNAEIENTLVEMDTIVKGQILHLKKDVKVSRLRPP